MEDNREDKDQGSTPPPSPGEVAPPPPEASEDSEQTVSGGLPPAPEPDGIDLPPTPEALLEASAAPAQSPAVSFTPMSDKSRRRVKRAIVTIVVLAVLGGVGALSIMFANWTRTPEATVRQYLAYLAAGNASAATAMVDPGLPNEQRGFLTNDVMASAKSRIVVEDVVATPYGGNKVTTVTATMQLDGERFTYSFGLIATEPTFGVLKNWKMQNALIARVNVTGKKVSYFTVGGVKGAINTGVMTNGTDYMFYPGVYTFTAADTTDYIDADPVTLRVKADMVSNTKGVAASSVKLTGAYNDALASVALDAAVALTNSCATATDNANKVCPQRMEFMGWTVQEIKSLPTSMKPNGMGERTYSGQATFLVVNKTGRDKKPKEFECTVEVVVKTDNAGMVLVDEDGKPKLEATFA